MQFLKHYKFTIVVVMLILVAILMPSSDVPSVGIPHIDKVVHFGMFGCLALTFYSEYYWRHERLPKFISTWLVLEVFAALTEVMQHFTPDRSMDYRDLIADSLGIIVCICFTSKYIASIKKAYKNKFK